MSTQTNPDITPMSKRRARRFRPVSDPAQLVKVAHQVERIAYKGGKS